MVAKGADEQTILSKLKLLSANELITSSNVKQVLSNTNLSASEQDLILKQFGINGAISQNLLLTKQQIAQNLVKLVQAGQLDVHQAKELADLLMQRVATDQLTGSNLGLAASFKTLMASMGPIGWISIGISLLISAFQLISPHIKSASTQLDETANTIKSNNDEIKSLNDELQTTQSRINELKAKGKLSFTEASELKELEKQNAALRDKIDLLEVANQKEQLNATRDFKKLAGTKYGTWESRLIMGDKSDIEEITRFIKEGISPEYVEANFKKYSDALDDLLVTGVDYEKADEETKKYIDSIYEMRDAYLVANGQAENLFDSVYNRDKYSEARTAIEELGAVTTESLQELYNTNPQVKAFVDYLFSLGTTDAMNITDFLSLLPGEFKKIEDNAENAAGALVKFASDYDSIKKDIEGLTDAYEQMTEKGNISAETLFDILDKHPELIDSLKMENGQYQISANILKGIIQQKIDDKIQTYETARNNIANNKEEIKSNIEKTKSIIANIKAKKEEIKTSLLSGDSKYSIIDLVRIQKELNKNDNLAALEKDLANYESYTKKIAVLSNLNINSFLSSDSGNSGKTEAEKYFDELKYKLETNQITQEQYLKDLDWGYKHFYNKTADYLEEYAKYSQEVYDGFKDMYKEDLEAQKEAWEKKKDAVSEYYDNLREQIEDAHDEEDYEKERDEKRKEIFELDMRINELLKAAEDGSEKAKARIAELEEERLKAEEEYRDFETNKARENELARLEKEQEAEEKKIQGQIDGIQGQLDQLDKDTVSVRNAIIAYAKEKGVTLNFAYASGTRSSVGGLGRINEKGIEMISAPDGNGNYIPMLPNSYVFSAKATEFLWKLATEHSLPQAMYNSIAKSIKTQSNTPAVNIAQPITITMGDVIIKGNADKQTVADIKKQQENTVRMVLQKIKELQK